MKWGQTMNQNIVNEVRDYILFRAHNGSTDTPPADVFKEFNKRYPANDLLDEIIVGYQAAGDCLKAEAEELRRYREQRQKEASAAIDFDDLPF